MIYTLLRIHVLTSDQYGRTEDKIIGIFDNDSDLESAKKPASMKYKNYRHCFITMEVEPNVSYEEK